MVFFSHLIVMSARCTLRVVNQNLLRKPVHGESDKHNETNDLAVAAAPSAIVTSGVVAWMVVHVDGYERDGKPGAECHCKQSSNQRNDIDMAVLFRDIDGCLQHQNAEGNAWDPADKADHIEDAEQQEDNTARPVATRKHIESCDKSKDDVEDTGDPNELLREGARSPHVGVTKDGGHSKYKCKQDDCVGVQTEVISTTIYATIETDVLGCELLVHVQF